jgi:U4/U6.U5 tri-snRNP-associated protein 1
MKLNMNLDIAGSATAEEWVKGSRIKEKDTKAEAKRLAELKQKQLDDEDEELAEQSSRYNSSHLKGLKVMHAVNDFEEGQDVILTLKDTGILELDEDGKAIGLNEEGDELENVNLADKDRRLERESKKRRLNQPIYSALDDYEFQDGKATGTRAPMLPQYEREKKAAAKFELGDGGVANHDPAAYAAVRAEASAARVQSLLTSSKEASDYYSAKEFTAFSKSKKGRDKKNKAYRKKEEEDGDEVQKDASLTDSGAIESKAMDIEDGAPMKVAPKPLAPIKFKSLDLDEDDPDLAQALARSRRLALQTRVKDEDVALGTEDRGAIVARALAARTEVSGYYR